MNTIMNGLMLAVYWIGTYLIDAAGLKDKLTVFSQHGRVLQLLRAGHHEPRS